MKSQLNSEIQNLEKIKQELKISLENIQQLKQQGPTYLNGIIGYYEKIIRDIEELQLWIFETYLDEPNNSDSDNSNDES